MVSEQAILKRFTHLGLHDKRRSLPGHVCPNCRNAHLKKHYMFCPICGIPLSDRTGVLTMEYSDGYATNDNGRAYPCPRCSNSKIEAGDFCCRQCGQSLANYCPNDFCQVEEIGDGGARYCHICGSSATFLNSGLLIDWQPALEVLLNLSEWEEEHCGLGHAPQDLNGAWTDVVANVRETASTRLAYLLEGSRAKVYQSKLLLYVRTDDRKKQLDEQYYHVILRFAQQRLKNNRDLDEILVVSYEQFLPESVPDCDCQHKSDPRFQYKVDPPVSV